MLNSDKTEIYFCRHGQSYENIGIYRIDSPLTDTGIEQAKKLTGEFDCVIISPLRRCQETLHYSKIIYKTLNICNNFSERIFNESSCKLFQYKKEETDTEFFERVGNFHRELEELCKEYKKILLIGHSYFYNAWFRKGCFPSPPNAEIFRIS